MFLMNNIQNTFYLKSNLVSKHFLCLEAEGKDRYSNIYAMQAALDFFKKL